MTEHQGPGALPPTGLTPMNSSPARPPRLHSGGHGSAAPTEANLALKPAYFWWVFRQWWMVLLPVSLGLAAVACTIIMLTYKPDYRASALIMIEESAPYIAFSDEADTTGSLRYVETQIELLRSPLVLEILLADDEIARYPELAESEDRMDFLQEHLTISRINESELYHVAYVSKSPAHSAKVANSVVQEYLQIQDRTEYDRFQRVIDLLEEERRNRQVVVESLRQKVMELSKEVTGTDPFGYGNTLDVTRSSRPFQTTYAELTQVEVELEVRNAELRSLREETSGAAERGEKSGVLNMMVDGHAQTLAYEEAIKSLELAAEDRMSSFVDGFDPEKDARYMEIQSELEKQRDQLKKHRTRIRKELLTGLREADRAERDEAIADLEHEIATLETRKGLLDKKFKEESSTIMAGSSKSVALTFAEAELEREERVFEMIAGRKLAMQTESRAPARVTVRQRAAVPVLPVTKIPVKWLLLACAASFAAPFGLAVLREMSICRISEVEQLSRESSVRVIGEVSHFPIRRAAANSQSLPPKLRRQMFVYLESIDSLRTNLWLTSPRASSRVLVVTSAAAAEGKTCLATSLAVSIGNAEKKPVLVIDGDMRSPDVATVLNTRDRPGLAELLSNQASLSDVVQRVGKSNTYVIPAGRLKGNPHHVVREDRIVPLLAQLRNQFSTIVVDTPPIFGGSESLVFAKAADSVVVSVMRDVSRSKQLRVAIERLERAGAKVAGAVLNGTSSTGYAYSYGYGSYAAQLEGPDA